jgi:hypothetical protein
MIDKAFPQLIGKISHDAKTLTALGTVVVVIIDV